MQDMSIMSIKRTGVAIEALASVESKQDGAAKEAHVYNMQQVSTNHGCLSILITVSGDKHTFVVSLVSSCGGTVAVLGPALIPAEDGLCARYFPRAARAGRLHIKNCVGKD